MSRDSAFEYLEDGPFCLVALEPDGGETSENGAGDAAATTTTESAGQRLRAVQTNGSFERLIGPLYKFREYPFAGAATEGESRAKLVDAIDRAVAAGKKDSNGRSGSVQVRNVEILTLVGEAGMPCKRYFDWTVGRGSGDGTLLLFGYPCTERDVEERRKDEELIDFFQNAPIALHWLSGEGIVLWANQTELDVLGYTAEEYIGQPISKGNLNFY